VHKTSVQHFYDFSGILILSVLKAPPVGSGRVRLSRKLTLVTFLKPNVGRLFVKRFALRYQTVACLVCLSVTLVYCGQTGGWIRMPLGTEVGLGPGHIVLDGYQGATVRHLQEYNTRTVHRGKNNVRVQYAYVKCN